MSTYNSKFSGAEIDTLLEKVASGQVGGGGSSEKEELAKEVGATHKHTITIDMGDFGKARFVMYASCEDPFTFEELNRFVGTMGAYLNGYAVANVNNIVTVLGACAQGVSELGLVLKTGEILGTSNVITNVDFTNQTVEKTELPFMMFEPIPLEPIIANGRGTFTDTVTEL